MTDTADQGGTDRPVRLTLAAGQTAGSDRRRLLLVDDQGGEFTLDITPDLRAAVRGDSPRRLETPMSSSIRPREIQTRIRSGESAEAVAEAAAEAIDADPLLEGVTYSILEEDEDRNVWRIDAFPVDSSEADGLRARLADYPDLITRSEEHTSELQSH